MNILYPAEYFEPFLVDEMYQDEANQFEALGFAIGTVSENSLNVKKFNEKDDFLYRGWMMNAHEYALYIKKLRQLGFRPFTDKKEYLNAHHLPNWYETIKDFTAETIVVTDLAQIEIVLRDLNWGKFFIKDFVKSLKTSVGSVLEDTSKIPDLINEMRKFRGDVEGGVCIRKFEDYNSETEIRYFVKNGKVFSPSENEKVPKIILEVAKKIDSPFFSVDIIENKKKQLRIVEIGDGQVSDLTGWKIKDFVTIWT